MLPSLVFSALAGAIAVGPAPATGPARSEKPPVVDPDRPAPREDRGAVPDDGKGPDDQSPRALYDRGRKAYRVGDFDAAVGHWEKAYALSERPLLLYNISLAYKGRYDISRDVADLRRAKAVLDNFIKLAEADPELDLDDAPQRMAELDALIEEAERELEHDRPAPPLPRPVEKDAEPRPLLPEGPDPGRPYRIGGIAAMASGGALMLTAGGLAVFYAIRSQELGSQLRSELEQQEELNCLNLPQPTDECMTLEGDIERSRSEGRRSNRDGYISVAVTGGLGIVAVVAGAVVFTEGNRRSRRWERGLAQIRVTPWGRGIAVQGRF